MSATSLGASFALLRKKLKAQAQALRSREV